MTMCMGSNVCTLLTFVIFFFNDYTCPQKQHVQSKQEKSQNNNDFLLKKINIDIFFLISFSDTFHILTEFDQMFFSIAEKYGETVAQRYSSKHPLQKTLKKASEKIGLQSTSQMKKGIYLKQLSLKNCPKRSFCKVTFSVLVLLDLKNNFFFFLLFFFFFFFFKLNYFFSGRNSKKPNTVVL